MATATKPAAPSTLGRRLAQVSVNRPNVVAAIIRDAPQLIDEQFVEAAETVIVTAHESDTANDTFALACADSGVLAQHVRKPDQHWRYSPDALRAVLTAAHQADVARERYYKARDALEHHTERVLSTEAGQRWIVQLTQDVADELASHLQAIGELAGRNGLVAAIAAAAGLRLHQPGYNLASRPLEDALRDIVQRAQRWESQ